MTTVQNPITGLAPQAPRRRHRGVAWFVTGTIALVTAVIVLITRTVITAIDDAWRHDGYLTSHQIPLATGSHAIATERLDLSDIAPMWPDIERLLGEVRLRAAGNNGKPLFIGIAPADQADAYLNGVGHATLSELEDPVTTYAEHAGGAPAGAPADQSFWVSQANGFGPQAIEWPLSEGRWTIVVMNADGSPGVDANVDLGITAPVQEWAARLLMAIGWALALLATALLVIGAVRRRS